MIHSFFNSLSKFKYWKSSFPGLLLQLLLPFAGVLREYGFAPGEASSKLQVQTPMLALDGSRILELFCDQKHSGDPVFIQFVEIMQTA